MSAAPGIVKVVARIGLYAGFAGLGLLGLALIGMALSLPASVVERLIVLVLGIGGIVIAVGFLRVMTAPPQNRPA